MLAPHVHSVTVVHPPEVKAIVRARVMTDSKASLILAKLHAAKLLPSVWIPPQQVRDLRAVVAQQQKLLRLVQQAKNRLHALLHRHQIVPPARVNLFDPKTREWWESLSLTRLELVRVQSDLDTLAFARSQKRRLEVVLGEAAAQDERTPLLIQLAGVGKLLAVTILAAIGDIHRFPCAKKLVGYAGLGASVHDSGERRTTGRITKQGRRDLRRAMVAAANSASRSDPHWKKVLARLEPRLGRSKAVVAVARKLLVAVWHVLTKGEKDKHAEPQRVAQSLLRFVYRTGVRHLPQGMTALQYTRQQLDRLEMGHDLTHLVWGNKCFKLPPSSRASPTRN
jgi:transposase